MTLVEKYIAQLRELYPGQLALTIEQFSQITAMSASSVRSMLSRGDLNLTTMKPGKKRLIPISEVGELLAARTSQKSST
jgi:hypothetical protein